MKSTYQVLLYYKYVDIDDPERVRDEQRDLCQKLNLKGRIIVACEGINGTLEGLKKDTEKYIKAMQKSKYFKDITYKKSQGNGLAFPKLSVKAREEIVRLKRPDLNPNKITGKYLVADELYKWLKEKKDFVIVDMRNDYEYESGYFENSVLPGMHNFYDLPKFLPQLNSFKDKVVVTVCTGGVRCEKASGFLLENGFDDVYQLKDGIQTFMEKYPNQFFKGKLYVFDKRLTIAFETDDPSHEIVGKCFHCGISCDSYTNCAFDFCHYHYICCENCKDKELNLAFCKKICKERYLKQLNGNA